MKVRRVSGFSLTELVVAMAVAMILMAVSLPSFLRAYHSYRLSNAATQVADIVRLTRYEAIRQNRPVICVIQPDSSDPTMTDAFMTDTSGNQMTGINARTILLGSAGNLVSAGSVPGAGALPAAAQLGGTTPASVSPSGATVRFDARGIDPDLVWRLNRSLVANAMSGRLPNQTRVAAAWRDGERGFTLVEMLMATVIVVVGLVAVAQLVPTSMMLNANNRSDGSALVIAQKQMEALRALPLSAKTFTDPLGVTCPLGTTCYTGDPNNPGQVVGSPLFNNTPIIDYAQPLVTGYGFTYTDPNDPTGAVNDVRWAVVTINNGATTGKRIIVGAFRRGMKSPSFPISLDTLVSK